MLALSRHNARFLRALAASQHAQAVASWRRAASGVFELACGLVPLL
jgi:hypothetical protein